MAWPLFFSLIAFPSAFADPSRCEKVRAEAAELASLPASCPEARLAHETFLKGAPEAIEICRLLEAEVAHPPTLLPGTESERMVEAMDSRRKHIAGQRETNQRVIRELLPTPLDNNNAMRIPPTVSEDCGTEVEKHVLFRQGLLRGIAEFYGTLLRNDDLLLQQASSPSPAAPAPPPAAPVVAAPAPAAPANSSAPVPAPAGR